MPRFSSSGPAVRNNAPPMRESSIVYDAATGEVLEPTAMEETHSTSLVPADPVDLAPIAGRAPTELEVILQYGSWQVPLTVEERRYYLIAQSGVYKSVRTLGQAVALAGVAKTLGISEHAAFSGIYLMPNGMSMSAHLIGALVRRSGLYDYKVVEMTPERCEIVWLKHEKEIGRSEFTTEQARKNGSVKPLSAWAKTPDEMCRNRSLTKGARTYCGEVFAGAGVYTPEELEETQNG